MLKALAEGETNPGPLALGDKQLRATPEQFVRCTGCVYELNPSIAALKMALSSCNSSSSRWRPNQETAVCSVSTKTPSSG